MILNPWHIAEPDTDEFNIETLYQSFAGMMTLPVEITSLKRPAPVKTKITSPVVNRRILSVVVSPEN